MPTTTLTSRPCNESWATRNPIRCLAAAEAASKRRDDGSIVSRADLRGSSPTGS
jgi:hypothetical protein